MIRTMSIWIIAVALAAVPLASAAADADSNESELQVVTGTLSKLDLANGRGLLVTDLGRPIHFDVPKAYLFENVTVGARIAMQLDEYGRAVKVMDSSIPDLLTQPDGHNNKQPTIAIPDPDR